MEHLLRTRVGQFTLADSIILDDAEAIMRSKEPERILAYISPVDSFFEEAPRARVKPEAMKFLINGNTLRRSQTDLPPLGGRCEVRMYAPDGEFCALYSYDPAKDELKIIKMFNSGS